jgi:hypothetical protein
MGCCWAPASPSFWAICYIATALLGSAICLAAHLAPAVRNLEDDLADHDWAESIGQGSQVRMQMA